MERNDFSPAVKSALSYVLTLRIDMHSVSFSGLVSRTIYTSGGQAGEGRLGIFVATFSLGKLGEE